MTVAHKNKLLRIASMTFELVANVRTHARVLNSGNTVPNGQISVNDHRTIGMMGTTTTTSMRTSTTRAMRFDMCYFPSFGMVRWRYIRMTTISTMIMLTIST